MRGVEDGKYSLNDIEQLIQLNQNQIRCGGCGRLLSDVKWSLEHYEHDGGILLKDFDKRQWVYVECHGKIKNNQECGYGNAFWKILVK